MAVVAITRINYGKSDGTVVTIGVGQTVKGLSEDETRSLVLSGAAVETGKERKFSLAPVVGEQDDETLKRDSIIAKAASEAVDDDEVVTTNSDMAAQLQAAAQGAPAAPGGPAAQNPQGTREQQQAAVEKAKANAGPDAKGSKENK